MFKNIVKVAGSEDCQSCGLMGRLVVTVGPVVYQAGCTAEIRSEIRDDIGTKGAFASKGMTGMLPPP